ncbi:MULTISPECIES: gas vesicle protein GvpG [Nocardia]|uniref:gas vesicle protein GvpG n=1 Tax=Nocardia TaxID=1817 RepID=UPI000BF0DE52|nr:MULTISPECIES: gas vesicle protein GvpG [Nocardia]MBF6184099.1 gas vesicle protein GvpG [Nocardia farcinica]MBF6293043.1 gas vesicle protein GvpG [Nocardia farcinica]MBF6309942.1 gas vesicle protein GvpG [Nocardia farcinica]MBF6358940.1 gas vesicle protein GvpG [Nocardia farcinica]MBF6379338.1 gas vesicle protein GvpG [Nocardia farcinica]
MGVLSSVLTLPLAPLRGVLWVAEIIAEQVDQELYHPASVRRDLERVDEAAAAGELSDEQRAQAQQEVLDRMIRPQDQESPDRKE